LNLSSRSRTIAIAERRLPKIARTIAEFLVVAICTLSFIFTAASIGAAVLHKNSAGTRDSVEYWAAGVQLVHHGNPYDPKAILPIELGVGFPADDPALVALNPPTILPLLAPLGFLGARLAEIVWLLLLLATFIVSVRMVWIMHGRPKNYLHYLGYAFAPALGCLIAGQISLLILLGLVLFLRLHRTYPVLAGASLWFCALKPHLFLPFGIALIAWSIATRCYKVVLGAVLALAASAAIAFFLDPSAWAQYSQIMMQTRIDEIAIPYLSIALRRSIAPNTMWVQYLPALLGCLWAFAYFRRHRRDWDWIAHGSPLMLVSVLVAPYTWLIDQSILIPALLHAVYLTRSRNVLATLALASAVIEIARVRGLDLLHSAFYLWTAPAWLIWYLYAARDSGPGSASDPSKITGG
jgi:hypothetical protein